MIDTGEAFKQDELLIGDVIDTGQSFKQDQLLIGDVIDTVLPLLYLINKAVIKMNNMIIIIIIIILITILLILFFYCNEITHYNYG